MKTLLLKYADRLIGRPLAKILPSPRLYAIAVPKSILFIRPGGIGDAVLMLPVIRALKQAFPHATIDVLAEKRNGDVFSLCGVIDKIYLYDSLTGLRALFCRRYDVVIDTEQWHRLSAVVARLVRAPIKLGFEINERRRMFTHGIRYDLSAYEPDNFLSMIEPLGMGCHRNFCRENLTLPIQSITKATLLLKPICSDPFVVIFPGASIPEKRWGAEHFSAVARRLAENGYRIVVVGGREDRAQGELIAGAGGLNLAGMTTLSESAAVIARSRLVISGDSGVLHLAVGLDVPTVSLFGPGIADKWAPRGEKHIVINKCLPCSPCSKFGYTPKCPINAKCMADITVAEVVATVEKLLDKLERADGAQQN